MMLLCVCDNFCMLVVIILLLPFFLIVNRSSIFPSMCLQITVLPYVGFAEGCMSRRIEES